jgi:hypothetical protein
VRVVDIISYRVALGGGLEGGQPTSQRTCLTSEDMGDDGREGVGWLHMRCSRAFLVLAWSCPIAWANASANLHVLVTIPEEVGLVGCGGCGWMNDVGMSGGCSMCHICQSLLLRRPRVLWRCCCMSPSHSCCHSGKGRGLMCINLTPAPTVGLAQVFLRYQHSIEQASVDGTAI